jgi:hypothetical protein
MLHILILVFFTSSTTSARSSVNLNLVDSEESRTLVQNLTLQGFIPLLGGPSVQSTNDCGYSSGNFPSIPSGK